jgi:CheY-like chemotaxis protein
MLRAAPRVLVVDDDLPTCELLELALVDEGWEVQARTCAQEALDLLQQWAADVILLDLMMPAMDAETFLVVCRQQGAGETPILLLSAASNLDQQAARLGVSGALAKPFDIDELCRTVRQLVAQNWAVSTTGVASHGR